MSVKQSQIYTDFILLCVSETGIILGLKAPLPEEKYSIRLTVGDNQGLKQVSIVDAQVCNCKGADFACTGRVGAAGFGLPVILGILGGILALLCKTIFPVYFESFVEGCIVWPWQQQHHCILNLTIVITISAV